MAVPHQLTKKKRPDWSKKQTSSASHLELEVVHHLVADGREEELLVLLDPLPDVVEHRLRRHLDAKKTSDFFGQKTKTKTKIGLKP